MQIKFCGAVREVTGSCHLLTTRDRKILVDCGLFQGSRFAEQKNYEPFPFVPAEIDALLVTHAHLDHVGRIPKLIDDGFRGQIYMTQGTAELARLVLEDAYEVMEYEHRKFKAPLLYDLDDVTSAVAKFQGVDYHETIDLGKGVRAVFKDAGHIFGAAFIEVSAEEERHDQGLSDEGRGQLATRRVGRAEESVKRVVFSGDIGNVDVPILRDTEPLPRLDALLCESTYGDRIHEHKAARRDIIRDLIAEAVERGGTIMVPAFSIERTQEFLYELHKLHEHDSALPRIPVFLDSPLAIDATEVFKRYPEYYDSEAAREVMLGDDFLHFPSLQFTRTRDESKRINLVRGPKLVMAGAGMMNGGRILHHALRYLSDPKSTLIIVGYQAEGTLGRRLYEGASTVEIFGERVRVRCTVKAIGALSAHGDQKKLLDWIGSSGTAPRRVYCVHGEAHAATELAHRIRDRYGVEAFVPEYGETVEI